ncbi:MAG TPA: RNA-binding S4 domain-containing protein [Clostridiaceae bacterium]|nr:RNA-binding S4 domain-containing protein [Clostridiaceae bacterium]
MRLDKFLKVSRLIKRRTVANDLASAGRVTVNDRVAKPGTQLQIGDIITFSFGEQKTSVEVKKLLDSVRKEEAETMYQML